MIENDIVFQLQQKILLRNLYKRRIFNVDIFHEITSYKIEFIIIIFVKKYIELC